MEKLCINGRFVDAPSAKIPVTDRGFLYGDGVFETMRSYAGVVFKLEHHLSRLYKGMASLMISEPCGIEKMKGLIYKSMKINTLKNAYIRVSVTRGEGRFGITYKDKFVPNFLIVSKSFEGYPERMYKSGITAKIVSGLRQNEHSLISGIKTMNFLPYIMARLEAKRDGFDEAILLNTAGYVAEASTSNLFIVKNNAIITPSLDSGILPGITRNAVIAITRRVKIRLAERRLRKEELGAADEVFLTNSLAEVIPVVKIGSKRIGSGMPGDITKLLHISYQKEVIKSAVL
ncbi:MAG TPA: aminotransferase class IV [Candidatus Omnitrophota bacterium]|nr:aminotransferase class IV [Candidatus Omnitrophota bacterium]